MVRDTNYALEVRDIKKAFYDNQVLKGISFGLKKGEVLGLLGSNGAGKSTLMKIINGIYTMDEGQIRINGRNVAIHDAKDAQKLGISMVYQEFSLIPTLTVAQNMFLNVEPKKGFIIRDKEAYAQTKAALCEFGIDIDPNAELGSLSVGNQQLVEIIKALQKKPSVLILDEPTASLTTKEVTMLFSFIKRLKADGIAIFFISHHMQEIMQICDRAVVLRDGMVELNETTDKLTVEHMVQAMVGKNVSTEYLEPTVQQDHGRKLLEVTDLRYQESVRGVSLSVSNGEIVGIAGLMGAGRTELLECIFGIRRYSQGRITMAGQPVAAGKPWLSIEKGLFLVPENRHKSGIVGIHSIYTNMMMAVWKKYQGKGPLINDRQAQKKCENMRTSLDIASTGIGQEVIRLSGGNQQKVVFAKSLMTEPQVLLLDEPTTGIDVEAKASIAVLMRKLADNGSGILIASSETEELVRICDRVLIMKDGKIIGQVSRQQDTISQEVLERAIQG